MLDRDELAARYFAVLLTPLADDGPAQEWDMGKMAGAAVEAADALLAALVPVAPASGAPLAAPSPAATPAAYVPEQGHVLRHRNGGMVILDKPDPDSLVGAWLAWKMPGDAVIHGDPIPTNSTWWTYVRRATSSERAAAGLPVDESAVDAPAFDEAKEREAAKVAVSRDAGDDFTRGWIARARVAAKGGAS